MSFVRETIKGIRAFHCLPLFLLSIAASQLTNLNLGFKITIVVYYDYIGHKFGLGSGR